MRVGQATAFAAAAIAILTVTGCGSAQAGSAPPSPTPSPAAAVVNIVTDPASIGVYNPGSVSISAGQEVQWVFQDLNPHTVSADSGQGGYSSRELARGATFRHRFETAGTYAYHCQVHPEMHGTVIVG